MPLTIAIPEYDPDVSLIGKDGASSVDLVNGRYWLQGEFQLSILGAASDDWLRFEPEGPQHSCVVTKSDAQWWVSSLLSCSYSFSPFLELPGGVKNGPWLRTSLVTIGKVFNAETIIALPTASLSLTPKQTYDDARRFYYPALGGTKSVQLRDADLPHARGILLEKHQGSYRIATGGVFEAIKLGAFEGAHVEVPWDCNCFFNIDVGQKLASVPQVEFDGSAARFGIKVVVEDSAEAKLNDPYPYSATASEARVDRLEVGQWLSAVEFRPKSDDDVLLEIGKPVKSGWPTSVRSGKSIGQKTSELRFHMPLDAPAADDSFVPQFEFRSAPEDATDRREPYRGIRVRGIGWSKSGAARLDTNVSRIALVEQKNGAKAFALQGGTKIEIKGEERDSVVSPKLDRAKGKRLLTIPAGPMAVEVAGGEKFSGISPITINTAKGAIAGAGKFSIADPKLVGPPVGAQAFEEREGVSFRDDQGPAEGLEYSRWRMELKEDAFDFKLTDEGAFPHVKSSGRNTPAWQEVFETETTDPFPLLEHPGSSVTIDGNLAKERSLALAKSNSASKKTTLTSSRKWDATGKEKLVYSTLVTLVSYKLIRIALKPGEKFLPDDSIIDTAEKLSDPNVNKWVKANGIDDHIRVYFAKDKSQDDEIKRFILENVPLKPDTKMVYWPFAMGISVLLYRQDKPNELGSFAPAIARERGKDLPGLAFDWSHLSSLWERFGQPSPTEEFGWNNAELTRLANASPQLWPRKSGNDGARLDPTDKHWRGILARHLPMVIYLPPAAQEELEKVPFLKKLIDTINEHLVLDYGWKDETGPTWNAELFFKTGEGIVSPNSWKDFIVIRVASFGTAGAAGKIINAKGTIEVTLPKFTDDANKPIVLNGEFTFNLDGGPILERVEVSTDNTLYKSNSFPGFKEFKISRFSTDFRSVEITFELTASDGMATALPFLSPDAPLVAVVRLDLTGEPGVSVSFVLPSEQNTNLFGKWPLVVQGLRMTFSPHVEISAQCRLNLGLASFTSIGAKLLLKKNDGDYSLKVIPNDISGSIDFGDFSIEGALYWTEDDGNPPAEGSAIEGDASVVASGPQRDIWGLVRVKSGDGLFDGLNKKGNTDALWLRIGSRGEVSFWIIALSTTREISFGAGTIEDGMFIIAKNADKELNGKKLIEESLANLQVDAMKKLRVGKNENPRNWLASWQPSSTVGTLVAASGYIKFQEPIAASSKGDDDSSNKYMTSLAFTSNGIIRVEAAAKLLGTANVRFGIGVDLPRKYFSAGVILPTLNYPSDSSPEFTIQGGQIILGVGFGDEKEVYLSVGWP